MKLLFVLLILYVLFSLLAIICMFFSYKRSFRDIGKVRCYVRKHWMSLLPSWFVSSFLFMILLPVTVGINKTISENSEDVGTLFYMTTFWYCAFFASLVYFISAIVKYATTELSLTEDRVIGRTGLFNIEKINCPIKQISSISIKQGIIGQAVDYATIIIHTTGSGKVLLKYIRGAVKMQEFLLVALEKEKDSNRKKQADEIRHGDVNDANSRVKALKDAADLYNTGAITDEEFKKIKNELLKSDD